MGIEIKVRLYEVGYKGYDFYLYKNEYRMIKYGCHY